MKPHLRLILQRERDFRPQFYQDMSKTERDRQRIRDNGLIPKGEVVECRWSLQDFSGITDPSILGLDPPDLRDYRVGESVVSSFGVPFRVANWRYIGAGREEVDSEGNERQIRVVSLTTVPGNLTPIDQGLLDEMTVWDDNMAALIEDGQKKNG